MQRKPISIDIEQYPEQFRPLLQKGALYDSSCSREARVIYIDADGGLFLKSAPKGMLAREAELMPMGAFDAARVDEIVAVMNNLPMDAEEETL